MKRCLVYVLSILMLVSMIGCAKMDVPEQTMQKTEATQSPEEERVLKIFTIGNSHSNDATQLLYRCLRPRIRSRRL